MGKTEEVLKQLNQPVTKEQLEKIVYSIFCIIIFITPFFKDTRGMAIYSLWNTIFIIVTATVAITLLILNYKKIKINIYHILFAVYLLLVALSTMFTEHGIVECILGTNGRGEGLITIICYVLTFIIFANGHKQMKGASKIIILAIIFVAGHSFIQAYIGGENLATGAARANFGNQNFLSSYVCLFLPMSCFYYTNYINSRTRTIISLLLSSLLFMTLIFASTLGGYITFAIMLTIISIFSVIYSKNKKTTVSRILILLLVFMFIFIGVNIMKDGVYNKELVGVKTEVENLTNGSDKFGSGRMEIWKKSLDIINRNKLFGVGPDSMKKELKDESYITNGENDILNRYIIDKAHSEPLHIAVTTGIPSAVIYVLIVAIIGIKLFSIVIKDTKNKGIEDNDTKYKTLVLICFASYLMQSVINISVIQVAPIFFAVMGTASSLGQVGNDRK